MDNEKVWLSSPHMGGDELKYIHQAFEKNWIAPLGDNVNGFENDLKQYTGNRAVGVFTSGTASMHLALILLGIKASDEVICQSFTFSATANPIRYQQANPVFIDSEPDTWNMDPEALEQYLSSKKANDLPKAIIVVHLYGMPAKMDEINSIAAAYDIPVIEDAAEALGSSINGKSCSSFGLLNILSFNGNKIITTSGGGALLSDNKELIDKARFLATQARDDAPHYQHTEVGYNYRMSNILAGIGRGQMKVIDERVQQRRSIHERYFNALGSTWLQTDTSISPFSINQKSPHGIYFLKEPEGYYSNRWLTTIVVNPDETGGVKREDIRLALSEHNIEARPLWKPMHLQPVYQNYPFIKNSKSTAAVSDWLFEHGLCLPSGSNMSLNDQARTIEIINQKICNTVNYF